MGWIETPWTPRRFPTRQDLDAVSPDNPVFLSRADGHAGVANSAALKAAGVTASTRPPFGGDILKDASGQPTGMLIDRAQGLVESKVPSPTLDDYARAITTGADRSLQLGWTQIQDAGGPWQEVQLMRKLYAEGKVKLRIYKAVHGPGSAADSLFANGPSIGEFDGRFTVRTIKGVLDGALGSRGALLLAPYSDAPDKFGLLLTPLERYRPMLVQALREGIQVETHAIGDSANRLLLDTFEEAFSAVPVAERKVADPRWRDEHTQIVEPSDLPRFKQLGVIPSMQPSHAIGDLYFAPSRLGTERLKGAYAWQSLVKDGNIIAGGSDAPVERGEPMIEFYAAVARRSITGDQTPDWHPEEALTREQALKAFTIWPAFAAFEEAKRGTIEVGKWADFTILDQDIMKIPEAEILKVKNVMTVVGGEVVYRAK
jgi:predicted amidohydrolase YtcJ